MKKEERKITILMALKNASSLMDFSITSVIGQKYTNFEFIFALGESVDDTLARIKDIESKFSTKIISGQNNGIYEALNHGLELAEKNSLVCILGAGDFFLHENVFSLMNENLRNSEDWCITPWVLTKENYDFIEISGDQNFSGMEVLTTYVPLCHQTVFAPAEFIMDCGAFNTRYKVAADRDLIFKMWKKNPPKVIQTVSVVYPQGGFSSRKQKEGHSELRKLRRMSRVKFWLLKSRFRNNLRFKNLNETRCIQNKIFDWCPTSIKEGITH